MSSNRRQHFVPQAYLRNFADGNRLAVFRRPTGMSGVIREFTTSSPNIAVERDVYTIVSEQGRDTSFDEALQTLERRIPSILAPLNEDRELTDAEMFALVEMAAVQDLRHPTRVTNIAGMISRVQDMARALYRQYEPELSPADIEDRLRENWGETGLSGAHALDPRNLALRTMDGTFHTMPLQFEGYCGCVITSLAHDFITSDHPVTVYDPKRAPSPAFGVDRTSPTIEVTFPLTRRHLLLLAREIIPVRAFARGPAVTMLNSRTAFGSHREVYGFPVQGTAAKRRQRRDVISRWGVRDQVPLVKISIATPEQRSIVSTLPKRWRFFFDLYTQHANSDIVMSHG